MSAKGLGHPRTSERVRVRRWKSGALAPRQPQKKCWASAPAARPEGTPDNSPAFPKPGTRATKSSRPGGTPETHAASLEPDHRDRDRRTPLQSQPRSGERMQPTAQPRAQRKGEAVGQVNREGTSPGGAKETKGNKVGKCKSGSLGPRQDARTTRASAPAVRPGGTPDNSPAFPTPGTRATKARVPLGTPETHATPPTPPPSEMKLDPTRRPPRMSDA